MRNLADDVGRQEREGRAGECPRQFLTKQADILRGRTVILLQLDLDIAVLRPDHTGVVIGHVDAADRHPDVVDDGVELVGRDQPADRLLDVGELRRAFLDTGADLGADMHQDLPGIDRRKKFRPRNGTSRNEAPTNARNPATKTPRCASAMSSSPR